MNEKDEREKVASANLKMAISGIIVLCCIAFQIYIAATVIL